MTSDATTTAISCPSWCDPREHVVWTPTDHDHRDEPTVIEDMPIGSVAVQRTQFVNPVLNDVEHEHLRIAVDDGEVTAAVDLHLGDLDLLIEDLIRRRHLIRGY